LIEFLKSFFPLFYFLYPFSIFSLALCVLCLMCVCDTSLKYCCCCCMADPTFTDNVNNAHSSNVHHRVNNVRAYTFGRHFGSRWLNWCIVVRHRMERVPVYDSRTFFFAILVCDLAHSAVRFLFWRQTITSICRSLCLVVLFLYTRTY